MVNDCVVTVLVCVHSVYLLTGRFLPNISEPLFIDALSVHNFDKKKDSRIPLLKRVISSYCQFELGKSISHSGILLQKKVKKVHVKSFGASIWMAKKFAPLK